MWGVIPAAGQGSRIQPLAFSKELLPVGSRRSELGERPRAVSEYILDRMLRLGVDKFCFVISPGKSDIVAYYGASYGGASVCYVVQPRASGLCDAVFRAAPFIGHEPVAIGLPDTIWFPEDAMCALPDDELSFLLFPVADPHFFDAVVLGADGRVREIEVKKEGASTNWVWGAFRMPAETFHTLNRLWAERQPPHEYFGSLVNEFLARGGRASGVCAGEDYVDVGTLHGYREAMNVLRSGRGRAGGAAA